MQQTTTSYNSAHKHTYSAAQRQRERKKSIETCAQRRKETTNKTKKVKLQLATGGKCKMQMDNNNNISLDQSIAVIGVTRMNYILFTMRNVVKFLFRLRLYGLLNFGTSPFLLSLCYIWHKTK